MARPRVRMLAPAVALAVALLGPSARAATPGLGGCGAGWSLVQTRNPAGSSHLNGVAAVGVDDVWAVGASIRMGVGNRTLIEHWDGVRWTTVVTPNAGSIAGELYGASGSGPQDVWAVGTRAISSSQWQPLIEHWNGKRWSVAPSPAAGTDTDILFDVSASSPTEAWAVGETYQPTLGTYQPLVLHWDGRSWSLSTPPPGLGTAQLNGVVSIAPNDAWAVGTDYGFFPVQHDPLLLHWNGTAWSKALAPGFGQFFLNDVAAASGSDVWAVGQSYDFTTDVQSTYALHWNGTAWSAVATPSAGSRANYLYGVTAIAPGDVWAVGNAIDDGGPIAAATQTLHWNGRAWEIVRSVDVGTGANVLNDVAAVPSGAVWAVGSYVNPAASSERTQSQRYC